MATWEPFFTQFNALITAGCPELTSANIWPVEVVEHAPADQVTVPYAVVERLGGNRGNWSLPLHSTEVPMRIWYLRKGSEDRAGLMGRLEALWERFVAELKTRTLTVGQVLNVSEPLLNADLDVQQRLISKQPDVIAGCIVVTCLVQKIPGA
jgi:hypothetical protein